MRRLLWKEFRERRWWAAGWAISILGISLLLHGQSYCGEACYHGDWRYLPLLLAFLVGTGGYSSELKEQHFIHARPLRWQTMLLAMLLFGAIIILGVPLLAALCYGLFHLHHLPCVTLTHLLAGVGAVAYPMLLPFLFGLACSVLVPGLAGGILIAVVIVVSWLLGEFLVVEMNGTRQTPPFFLIYHIVLATFCAALSVLPIRIMLGTRERLKRFLPVFMASSRVCTPSPSHPSLPPAG